MARCRQLGIVVRDPLALERLSHVDLMIVADVASYQAGRVRLVGVESQSLEPEELESDIRSTGFYRNKSKSVVGAARMLLADFGGVVPDEMDKLLTLPGVARKTANVVLGSWFGKGVGVVVDTHVHRISRRLELTTNDDPGKIEQDLLKVIPQPKWILFSHQIIHHGRSLCIARKPKCVACPLENLCHAGDKTWSTVEMHKGAE